MTLKYNKDSIYSTANTLEVTVNQTGSKAMIREQGQDEATMRQGYRVVVSGETVGYGEWSQSERDLLLEVIKEERYAHLAYRELYYDMLNKLASIGLVQTSEGREE
jgi:hypothetical protein